MKSSIMMIAYFFDESNGVGALRSRTLHRFLEMEGIEVNVVDKSSFGKYSEQNMILWCCMILFRILVAKEKKIYVSCGPFQPLLFISIACWICQKKLIIDFRDPWSLNIKRGYNENIRVNRLKLYLSEIIEKLAYKICYKFIVCTKGMYSEYELLFKSNLKLHLMTNGYDFEIDNIINKPLDFSDLNIVCLGKFAEYDKSKARKAFEEILNLVEEESNVTLHFIGSEKDTNMVLLKEYNLEDRAIFYERMNYREALKIAERCNLAVLVIRDESIDYGTKVFDYIGLGLYIINNFEEDSKFKKEFISFIFGLNHNSVEVCRERFNRNNIYKNNIGIFK